jgi:predicted ATPase/class 3 adenylate cyclase
MNDLTQGASLKPGLPRGTVAFLFTDIEGSTRLWERDAAAMRRALARHNALLDAAVAAHGGVHFKTVGDAFQVAFPNASAAVVAAVAAQRALAAEPWPETSALGVRMAIHVGVATPRDGDRPDYVAPALSRLNSLLAIGHGGQTLLSGAARLLAGARLPSGVGFRDLGFHRLRDLLEAEHVWHLTIVGLPADFPPLRSLEHRPTNLPAQPTALVGRDALVADVLPVLTDPATRLLTLTGPGGVGKTRLAVHLAAEALDAFPDGVFFVDLSAVADPGAVLPAITATLGVREGGGLSLTDAIVAFLAAKRVLLLLDNLEQIRPAAALGREIAALLEAAPRLTILATSRAQLRIRAEREWPLDPLAAPDATRPLPAAVLAENPAVALFLERAQALKPSFALTDANAATVAEIVGRLDGLPLALELAAVRLRILAPSQLRDRLGTQLDLLAGSSRDHPDRQQTLRATIRWSHDLLTPEQQAVFRRLGVFAGGLTLEAAEAVAAELGASGVDVLDGMAELLAESLLRTEETASGETRYRMLETIRAYACERLVESGEEAKARAAHLRYFTGWAEEISPQLGDGDRAAGLGRFAGDHANLQAALGWALDAGEPAAGLALAARVWKFWQFRAYFGEGRLWLDRLLAATPHERTEDRTIGFEAAGVLAWNQGDLTTAESLLHQALALAAERGDEPARARSLNNLGNVRNLMGDLDGAAAYFAESLDLERARGNRRGEAIVLNNLALIAMDRGALDEAQALLEESLALKRQLGVRADIAIVLGNLALIAWLRRDVERSIELLEQGLAIERETENPVGIADALGNLAQMVAEAGQPGRAVHLHRESLLLRRDVGDWLSMPYSLEGIAAMAVAVGLFTPAVRLFGASEALREGIGAPITATDRDDYDEIVRRAQDGLGDDAFAARWREGRLLAREEAVEAALALSDAVVSHHAQGDGMDVAMARETAALP